MGIHRSVAIVGLAVSLVFLARAGGANDRPELDGAAIDREAAGTANEGAAVNQGQRQGNGGQAVQREKNGGQAVQREKNGGQAVQREKNGGQAVQREKNEDQAVNRAAGTVGPGAARGQEFANRFETANQQATGVVFSGLGTTDRASGGGSDRGAGSERSGGPSAGGQGRDGGGGGGGGGGAGGGGRK